MWGVAKSHVEHKKEATSSLVAVAIDGDKNSQHALKWAIDNVLPRGQAVLLLHVKINPSLSLTVPPARMNQTPDRAESALVRRDVDPRTRDLLLPFRCFCMRKNVSCKDIVLEDYDVAKCLVEYVSQAAIDVLVIGASSKGGFLKRFKTVDVAITVTKYAPDFSTVYVISKGKMISTRSAVRSAPAASPLRAQLLTSLAGAKPPPSPTSTMTAERPESKVSRRSIDDKTESLRSPLTRRGANIRSYWELPIPDTDISFVSLGMSSVDRMFPTFESLDPVRTPGLSNISDLDNNESFESMRTGRTSFDFSPPPEMSSSSSEGLSSGLPPMDDVEAEMRRLKLELKQTMELYNTACREALTARQKAEELQRWKMEEEKRLEEARLAEEAAMTIVGKEKAKSKAAIEAAEAAQKIAELEAQKRINAEMKALEEAEERKKAIESLAKTARYRKYTIDEIEAATEFFAEKHKIGEGGYGPVFKGYIGHTPVAVKLLRPDASQGRSQFQQEVEVLSSMRHPNLVLLLGACPEYGCLVYEYMARGNLEDCLLRRGANPPLSWQTRFRIAADIGTGLLFLHQSKPEPLVHRDLKPANILLDRNYISKIADVGLARLVPASVAENVTQYRMTSTAGTFCYIDPEYQQTGMLGVKSDIYSLGIIFLQMISAKPPMGLTHFFDRAIENRTFEEMLDPDVPDWPIEETLLFAKMALKCAELRRKDRPDLAKEVLPLLNRLRSLAEESAPSPCSRDLTPSPSPPSSIVSMPAEEISNPKLEHSGSTC